MGWRDRQYKTPQPISHKSSNPPPSKKNKNKNEHHPSLKLSTMLSFTALPFLFGLGSLLVSFPATGAQDISGLPPCASNCLAASLTSIGKSCAPTDFACLCKNSEFISASSSCYTKSCSAGDLASAQAWGIKSCAAAGVQIAVDGVTNATTPATTNSTSSNASPVNDTSTSARPNSAVALPVETVKSFAIGSALLASLLIV